MGKSARGLLLAGLVASAAGLGCHPSQAQGSHDLELLDILRRNGTLSEAEYQRLRQRTVAAQEAEEEKERAAKEAEDSKDAPTVKIGGSLFVDTAQYQDFETNLGSGSEVRRAQVFLEGALYRVWDYKFQYDFTDSGADGIQNLYLRFTGFKPIDLTVGNFKEPFSLDELTSQEYITFMERALPVTAFAPSYSLGLGLTTHGDNWHLGTGLFQEAPGASSSGVNQGWGIAGRITYAPRFAKTRNVHLGASAEYRRPDDDNELQIDTRPESHVTSVDLVTTGTIEDVDDSWKGGLEVATVLGPFSAQGEYIRTRVNRKPGAQGSAADFAGWYGFASYFFTGESRNYILSQGIFSRVTPNSSVGEGGIGAWEIGLRYSDIDLNSGDIQGGRERNITVGLNWYATPYVRFLLNYINAAVDNRAPGLAAETGNIYQARAQVDF